MRRYCKALGVLMTVVMIVTMFSSTILAAPSKVSDGTNKYYDWVLYNDGHLDVKLKSTTVRLSEIDPELLDTVTSVTFDFSDYCYNATYYFYDAGSKAESVTFTGCDGCSIDKIELHDFAKIENSAVKLSSGADFKTLFFDNCSINKIDFLGNNVVKTLRVNKCNLLTSIDLKNNVENLRVDNCEKFSSISNTGALKTLQINSAPAFKKLSIPKNLQSLTMYGCGLEEISIPSTCIAHISGGSLKKAIIESGRQKTDMWMFEGSKALEEVSLPEGLTVVQYDTFNDCKSLKNVSLPSTVVTIGQGAFNSSGLTSVTLPEGLKAIRSRAFAYCDDLKTVYMPLSVKEITVTAFDHDKISDVYYAGSEEQWNKITVLDADYSNHKELTLKETFGNAKIHFNYVAKTGWVEDNGKWYYYNANGVKATGWKSVGGKWFYFDASGVMATRWVQDGGKWYYMDPAHGSMVTGWNQIGGKWYYFDSTGVMKTGWVKDGGDWYYLKSSGEMSTGWVSTGGYWYYFDNRGKMKTGWQEIDGKWYCFDSSGAMLTGWQESGGNWFYLNSSGVMLKGWQKISGKWYFFKNNGQMATKWLQISGKWYWFGTNGDMAYSTSIKIDGKVYNFDSDGVCTNP
ncbi:leucine-rich repeat protein [Butyrivibrio sp. AE2032]|uniref:leucine-rich repeat protein n=1 Tax=Butyrivibrio sp. AE2032 TaxID=1458463 RepID=UPI00068A6AAB|nr:leucine-rich repeat protein [Butyrivibrio sp. AE2032]